MDISGALWEFQQTFYSPAGGDAAISGGTAKIEDRDTYYDSREDNQWIAYGILLYKAQHGQEIEVTWTRPEENNIYKDILDQFMQ